MDRMSWDVPNIFAIFYLIAISMARVRLTITGDMARVCACCFWGGHIAWWEWRVGC